MESPLLTKCSPFLTNPEERTDKRELFPHHCFNARGFCHLPRGQHVRLARSDRTDGQSPAPSHDSLPPLVATLFIGPASAHYSFFAPVFVSMFMTGASIPLELTQAACRAGDSCRNIITPQPLHCHHSCIHEEAHARGRDRNADRPHASVCPGLRGVVDRTDGPLDVHWGGPRTAAIALTQSTVRRVRLL